MFTCFFVCFWQQILEEQDFKEEDFGLFQLAGQRCIDEGHIDQLLEIIQNDFLLETPFFFKLHDKKNK